MAAVPPLALSHIPDDVTRTVSVISSNRARSVLEAQRIMALYSGNFYREILPALYDASIVDQPRFLALMESKAAETMLTTRELLELAIAWGITPSATEFWKRYKSREDLVGCLQRKKAEQELLARSEEHQPLAAAAMPVAVDKNARRAPRASQSRRRSSVAMTLQAVVGNIFRTPLSGGDIFGTQGDYEDSIVYRARRLCADDESLIATKAKLQGMSAYASFARTRVRNRGSSGDTEQDEDEDWTGLDDSPSIPDSPLRTSVAEGKAKSPQHASALPGAQPLPSLELGTAADSSDASRTTAAESLTDPATSERRSPAVRFPIDLAPPSTQVQQSSTAAAPVAPIPLRRAGSSRSLARAASRRNVNKQKDAAALDINGPVMDMDDFIARHSREDTDDWTTSGLGTPTIDPIRSLMTPRGPRADSATSFDAVTAHGDAMPTASMSDSELLLHKMSKLDLYFRPVCDRDRMVVVIPTGGGSRSPRRPGSRPASRPGTSLTPLVDHIVDSPRSMPATSREEGRGRPSRDTAQPTSAARPPSAASTPGFEPLAMRHRVGGRAGNMARTVSDRLRADLPTLDFKLSATPASDDGGVTFPSSPRGHLAVAGMSSLHA